MSEETIVELRPHDEAVWAVVRARMLDDLTCGGLHNEVTEAAAQRPKVPVVLDMTSVEYVPSLGLGTLVGLLRHLRQNEHRFVLVGLNPDVRMTLSVTRLDKLFEIQPSFDDAVSRLRERM